MARNTRSQFFSHQVRFADPFASDFGLLGFEEHRASAVDRVVNVVMRCELRVSNDCSRSLRCLIARALD